jgi:hypothetical protein
MRRVVTGLLPFEEERSPVPTSAKLECQVAAVKAAADDLRKFGVQIDEWHLDRHLEEHVAPDVVAAS